MPTARIEARLSDDVPVVRAMPNTPALIMRGATGFARGTHATNEDAAMAARIFGSTGIAVEVPEGHAGLVLPRSGLARDHGIALVNSPGLIDAGYRGEVRVLLLNTDPAEIFRLEAGERIAQLVFARFEAPEIVQASGVSESGRGGAGFGSTGRE